MPSSEKMCTIALQTNVNKEVGVAENSKNTQLASGKQFLHTYLHINRESSAFSASIHLYINVIASLIIFHLRHLLGSHSEKHESAPVLLTREFLLTWPKLPKYEFHLLKENTEAKTR